MDDLKRSLPELRYVFHHLKKNERVDYIRTASAGLIECLNQIIINLLYSHKNGMNLTSSQIKKLKPHKSVMKKFISTKSFSVKRKLLKNSALSAILEVIIAFATDANTED